MGNNKKLNSFKEKMSDKKYSAKVQLIGYGIFILIIILYLNIFGNKNYDYSDLENSVKNNTTTSSVIDDKSLLESIKDNYDYYITLYIEKDSINTYKYNGSVYKDIMMINSIDKVYYYKNDEYYYKDNDSYIIVKDSDIYSDIEYKYMDLDQILKYIDKASLDYTSNYSSGKIVSIYYLYLKDILTDYHDDKYVEISITEEDSILYINIDYTNLMMYKDNDIKSYKLEAKYSNINSVLEFDIDTN